MDFTKLFAAVLAFSFHSGSASKPNGQMICRRGTQRPCYKVSHIQDAIRRPTFEDARQACRVDGGELLSIETQSEQRLIERFIQQLQAGDGDFRIVLRRSPQRHRARTTRPACPSHYYWLDGSHASVRNWHWDEPSCRGEKCVVLYDQSYASPDGEGHGENCNSKNNIVCKYPEEDLPLFTGEMNTTHAVPSLRPVLTLSTTESGERTKIALSESSDNTLYVSYVMYPTVPAILLLLIAAAGFFCYKQHAKRRKTQTENGPSRSKPWTSTTTSPCPVQGPYAFSDINKLPHAALDSAFMKKYSCPPSQDSQCGDYENVSCTDRECGFVTNDIYEICRAQARHCPSQTGWVENEIYG